MAKSKKPEVQGWNVVSSRKVLEPKNDWRDLQRLAGPVVLRLRETSDPKPDIHASKTVQPINREKVNGHVLNRVRFELLGFRPRTTMHLMKTVRVPMAITFPGLSIRNGKATFLDGSTLTAEDEKLEELCEIIDHFSNDGYQIVSLADLVVVAIYLGQNEEVSALRQDAQESNYPDAQFKNSLVTLIQRTITHNGQPILTKKEAKVIAKRYLQAANRPEAPTFTATDQPGSRRKRAIGALLRH